MQTEKDCVPYEEEETEEIEETEEKEQEEKESLSAATTTSSSTPPPPPTPPASSFPPPPPPPVGNVNAADATTLQGKLEIDSLSQPHAAVNLNPTGDVPGGLAALTLRPTVTVQRTPQVSHENVLTTALKKKGNVDDPLESHAWLALFTLQQQF